jgi:hypothetical protein
MFTTTASGLSPHHQTWVTKVTLVQRDQQAQWVFKELQDLQVRVARLGRKDYVVKQVRLVYKDLLDQLAPQVLLAHKDY